MAVFGRFNSLQELIQYNSQHDPLSRFVNSILNKITGTALTGAESEANAFTSRENAIAREFSANQAQQQMDFQERMANTQYQRAVADMQAAGVNPALAMSQGGNVAPTGAAFSASGASSVSPQSGMSMSELVALATLKPQIEMMRAQAEDYKAAADLKRSQSVGQSISNEWNPKIWASEIGLREHQLDKLDAEVRSILATAEGQEIYNNFSPFLFESQLASAEVNRYQMIASIAKIEAEIEHYAMQNEGIRADIDYKRALQVLTAAQVSLTKVQADSVSSDVWKKQFENSFESMYGFTPDTALWSAIPSFAAKLHMDLSGGFHKLIDKLKGN